MNNIILKEFTEILKNNNKVLNTFVITFTLSNNKKFNEKNLNKLFNELKKCENLENLEINFPENMNFNPKSLELFFNNIRYLT